MQYETCERCGAHLDFGEICDCTKDGYEEPPKAQEKSITWDEGIKLLREAAGMPN